MEKTNHSVESLVNTFRFYQHRQVLFSVRLLLLVILFSLLPTFAFSSQSTPLKDSLNDSLNDSLKDSLKDSLQDSHKDSFNGSLKDSLQKEISRLFHTHTRQMMWRVDSEPEPSSQPLKCGTPLLKKARKQAHLLDPEYQFILYRPTESNDVNGDYYGGVEVWFYESTHFRIYYTETDTYGDAVLDADGQKETLPTIVSQFAVYLEDSWSKIISNLGYQPPVSEGMKVEAFILNISCYGITCSDDQGVYILLDNEYSWVRNNLDPEGKEAGAMKVTAAHEFFHVVQAVYDHWPDSGDENMWWEENTAVWVEEMVYDQVDDYLNYLGWPYEDENSNGKWDIGEEYTDLMGTVHSDGRKSGWFDYPHISLTKTYNKYNPSDCPFDKYEYGGVIWPTFLSEELGQGIIRTIFELIPDHGYEALQAISSALEAIYQHSQAFSSTFIHFKLANLLKEYEEATRYPLPYHTSSHTSYPKNIFNDSLNYLSCKYMVFHQPTAEGQALRFHFQGNVYVPFAVLAIPATNYEPEPQFGPAYLWPLNQNQEGNFDFSFAAHPQYAQLIIIPINLSLHQNSSYSLDVTLIDEAQFPLPPLNIVSSSYYGQAGPVVRLGWDLPEEQVQYRIWRLDEAGYQTMIFQSEAGQQQPYADANSFEDQDPTLQPATDYTYKIQFITGAGTSSSDFILVRTEDEPQLPVSQSLNLMEGWNWVSFTVLPADTSLEAVFGEQLMDIVQIKTQTRSATFFPDRGWLSDDFGLMAKIAQGVMFKIKAKKDLTLTILGQALDRRADLACHQGWNWIAYLPPACQELDQAVVSLFPNLTQIKGQTGSRLKNNEGLLLGDLSQMCPNQGYAVFLQANTILRYP